MDYISFRLDSEIPPQSFLLVLLNTLKDIIETIGCGCNIGITEIEVQEDLIHMVVCSEPKVSPLNILQTIKSISAKQFFKPYLTLRGNSCGVGSYAFRVIL